MTEVTFLVTVKLFDHEVGHETPKMDAAGFIPQLTDFIESGDACEVINIDVGEVVHDQG